MGLSAALAAPSSPNAGPRRARLAATYAGLALATAVAWGWALAAFHGDPVLLGAAALAYLLGLRHAVDADHIAAIDNTTRKLMGEGQRPLTVGLWFSLGHSTVVALACAAIAAAAGAFGPWLTRLSDVGGVFGTGVSAAFLIAIAAANLAAAAPLYRAWRRSRETGAPQPPASLPSPAGPLSRLLRPLMAVIRRPWQMYPLGFLFGLGFDTASEIGLLAIAAGQAGHRASLASVMVFPALFTAGMTLVDTSDGVLMAGVYGWAFDSPARRLRYNLVVTGLSIVVAVVVAGGELAGLALDRLGAPLAGLDWLTRHMGLAGVAIVLAFPLIWAASRIAGRRRATPGS